MLLAIQFHVFARHLTPEIRLCNGKNELNFLKSVLVHRMERYDIVSILVKYLDFKNSLNNV